MTLGIPVQFRKAWFAIKTLWKEKDISHLTPTLETEVILVLVLLVDIIPEEVIILLAIIVIVAPLLVMTVNTREIEGMSPI